MADDEAQKKEDEIVAKFMFAEKKERELGIPLQHGKGPKCGFAKRAWHSAEIHKRKGKRRG